MKKSFDNFAQCLELREVIFLKSLPAHVHLVPAYDIFLDPLTRKLHISMEYMDGNLYQLMKARDHKPLDGASVKSILFQILSGLEHIHEHGFFHRDIKPENVLVSSSSPESSSPFKRYSALMTPPSTPPVYSIKLADFGLARECHSRTPYTTYVSTRWYRAPEVLLRAGEYSAPVDIWALGAMAVEIATLKPLFPGANEVDQVWRVCEIMGSPGQWVNKHGGRIGGGEWKEGIKLAQKLGFSFPKMAPHSLTSVLPASQWPASLVEFITWCLLWDPAARPTSTQALAHEYFADATDPLRPKSSSASKILSRKQSSAQDVPESPSTLSTKTSSWFRRSLVSKDPASPTAADQPMVMPALVVRPSPAAQIVTQISAGPVMTKPKPTMAKQPIWNNANPLGAAAPIPILPSIRPVSPLPDSTTAQATPKAVETVERPSKKLGRQLSVNSSNNHYADHYRQETEKTLVGGGGAVGQAPSATKESFFSHLRKRARRFSGRNQIAGAGDDLEAQPNGYSSVSPSHRSSMILDQTPEEADPNSPSKDSGFAELDSILNNVRYSLEGGKPLPDLPSKPPQRIPSFSSIRRLGSFHKSVEQSHDQPLVVNRTRMSIRNAHRPDNRYETPDEEDELLNDALVAADRATKNTAKQNLTITTGPYLTPSPSKENTSINFERLDARSMSKPLNIKKAPQKPSLNPQWPTPPDDEGDWASVAAASILAAQACHR